jgi:prepilin-type N-terminal cleavage/methylation domain-containing protein
MKKRRSFRNQKGFTLIELLSVMIIMGVMSSVAVKKVDFITDTASTRALATTVKELNVRESLVWSNMKISQALQLMVERFTVNRNQLFLIVPTLQSQQQGNGNNS